MTSPSSSLRTLPRTNGVSPSLPSWARRDSSVNGRVRAGSRRIPDCKVNPRHSKTSGHPALPLTTKSSGVFLCRASSFPAYDFRSSRSSAGSSVFQTRVPGGIAEKSSFPCSKKRFPPRTSKILPPCSWSVSPPVSKATPSPGFRWTADASSSTWSRADRKTFPTKAPRFFPNRAPTSSWWLTPWIHPL